MKKPILFSIIIPCYNYGLYIEETLNSISFDKNDFNYEIIIINDGSTDAYTLNILEKLEQSGYMVLHQSHQGPAAARNLGIGKAKGKYILPLDSDDLLVSEAIVEGLSILETNEKVGVVYGNYQRFGEHDYITITQKFDLYKLLYSNCLCVCSLFRRSIWEEIDGFDEKLILGDEDWDFWLRIALKGWHFHHLGKIIFHYRIRSQSFYSSITKINEEKIRRSIFSKPEYSAFKEITTKFNELYSLNDRTTSRKWLLRQLFRLTISQWKQWRL